MSHRTPASGLPNGLSADYWSTWIPIRKGSSVSESVDKDVGEQWIGSWDGIGLYEGNNKIPLYQSITVHLTNHRLILIPESTPSTSSSSTPSSLAMYLSYVRQTEFYAGFMRSSAKITLTLGQQTTSSPIAGQETSTSDPIIPEVSQNSGGWTCNICGYVNPLSGNRTTPMPGSKCGLCGIPYSTSQSSVSATPSRSHTPSNSVPHKNISSESSPPSSQNDANISTPNQDGLISCPACTFLNSPLLPNCEICSTPLPKSTRNSSMGKSQNTGLGGSSNLVESLRQDVVRLSFRKGGEKEAYKKLKAVLSDKAWERDIGGSSSLTSKLKRGTGDVVDGVPRSGAGIDGILQQIDLNSKSQSSQVSEAFADLEALMLRAGEMVKLAQNINARLTTQLASNPAGVQQPTEEETTMIRSSLVQLGLAAPAITKEMMRDEQRYHQGLAKELGELLTGRISDRVQGGGEGLMIGRNGRGVIALDEVWGLWMRARGVSLLPPSTLISILPHVPTHTSPTIKSLILPSSLQVLHTPHYSTPAILSRTLDRLCPLDSDEVEKSFTSLEFSDYESLPIGLAKEFIEIMEKTGDNGSGLVRDDQSGLGEGGVRWYRDIISEWPLDGV
ncbi:uncharacterized protein I206_104191 [Kwoniella pini CBS 10737]|uniref:Vacuolar protein-sorting-associated protein 36 n=1 Tax=Kwoniella pini CBS 10737 TaxID=1296096 RepID=A0A1B9I2D2_9TREE|nr:ESCRT-II complex subunit VPS36 [Kwoniella pini CBS 10737]OCF49710.1 ESCRT-II complex subunit VPS36 [Kwoniella pini CBS 10737]